MMMGWFEYIAAGVLFLVTHRVPTIPSIRAHLIDALGARGFIVGYSVVSLVLLTWLIVAAGRAPFIELWAPAAWQAWVPNVLMPIVCLLAVFSIGVPNPLSFGGSDSERFDPNQPGIVAVARHGILWALALWSACHIIPNGNLAHVILFGAFCAFSLFGMWIIDHRKQHQMGLARWNALARATSFWPLQALFEGRWRPSLSDVGPKMLNKFVVALVVYLALLWLHPWLIGVSPWPVLSQVLNETKIL